MRSPHIFTRKLRLRPGEFLFTSAKRLLQHGVIPGSSPDKAPGISSLGMHEAILMWPRKRLESSNEILCRTGRIVEANINLRGEPDGISTHRPKSGRPLANRSKAVDIECRPPRA